MRLARFGLGFALVSIMGWAIYAALFFLQMGTRAAAEYWVHDAMIVKHALVRTIAEQHKMIFLGGSSVWFGIDAGLVQQTLGTQTLNLGLHAMRPLDQLVSDVQPALRAGDSLIMPLEFEYYTIDTPYNYWYVNQVMAVEPEVFWALAWPEKFLFFSSVSPMRVFEGIATKVFSDRMDRMQRRSTGQSSDQVMASIQEMWAKTAIPEETYTFHNIDHHGDAIVTRGSFTSYTYPITVEAVARAYPWKTLISLAQYCAVLPVALYVGWPPVVKGEIAFDSPRVRDRVRMIERRLSDLGIPVLGHPEDFQYERAFFTDSAYHLSHEGRTLHTRQMLHVLKMKMDHG